MSSYMLYFGSKVLVKWALAADAGALGPSGLHPFKREGDSGIRQLSRSFHVSLGWKGRGTHRLQYPNSPLERPYDWGSRVFGCHVVNKCLNLHACTYMCKDIYIYTGQIVYTGKFRQMNKQTDT